VATLAIPRRLVELVQIALLAVAYFAAAKLSLLLAVPPGYASAVWPPSGIALAAVLLAGTRIWPGIWLGAAFTNLTIQGAPLLAAMIACGNTLEAVVGAELVRRHAGGGKFDTGEQVIKFVGLVALCASIAAGIGVFSLALNNALSWSDVLTNVWTWWEGDAAGMIVVTPFILCSRASGWPRWSLARATEALVLLASLAAMTLFVFAGIAAQAIAVPLAFLTLPFVIWAAIRFEQREVMAASAVICTIAIYYTLRGLGPWGAALPNLALLALLGYTCTVVITGLVLSAVIGERERAMLALRESNDQLASRVAERTRQLEQVNEALRTEVEAHARREQILRESEERIQLIVNGVKDYAIFSLDPDGNVTSWNTGAQSIKGYSAAEIIGKHFSTFYTPEDIARNWPRHELDVARVEGRFEDEGWRVRKDGSRFWANVIITALYDNDHRLRGFAKVTRDLTARRRIEALQETERQMNEFLAMLAHELRNPLAAIVNALALMRSKQPHDQVWLRDVIDRQTTHLARIVDDLLDLSRITRGKIDLQREQVDLNGLVFRVLDSCRASIDVRHHHVDLQLSAEALPVDADPTRLTQVVHNLISNAVKYTPDGGQITIELAAEGGNAVLRVRDNGIGIPSDLLPRVFELFVQGDRAPDRSEAGLGIGLTLVKRMVELHGGSVQAASEGPGKGSEFTVRLPLARHRPAVRGSDDKGSQAHSANRRRLLVVDDNRDLANTLAELFEVMGHEVRAVHDGPTAISVATEYRPHAVFLDVGLPGMDGYEVARAFRNSPEHADVILVAFTGYGQEEDRRRVQEAGFDHHLVKPGEASQLAKIVDSLPSRA
jgi:PAS domain S-box-containing protein